MILLCAAALLAVASPASAATPEPMSDPAPTTTVAELSSAASNDGAGAPAPTDITTGTGTSFAQRYESLAAAMVQFYATEAGMTLESFLGANGAAVAGMVGMPGLGSSFAAIGSFEQFELRLRSAGATIDVTGVASYDDLLTEIQAKATSMDGRVALLGASYAGSLASLHLPDLTMPELPAIAGTGPESLAFGLFMNESLTTLVSQHPDVFAQVRQSGLGTPEALAAWRASMLEAGTVVGNDLSRLPMPCIGEMLQAMASGSAIASGAGCGSCAVAGAYLHNQTVNLLDPNANTSIGAPTNGIDSLQPWLADALTAQNPSLAAELDDVLAPTNALAGCTTASQATSSALGSLLPNVFANLAPGSSGAGLPGGFSNIPPPPTASTVVPSPNAPAPSTLSPALPGGFAALPPADD